MSMEAQTTIISLKKSHISQKYLCCYFGCLLNLVPGSVPTTDIPKSSVQEAEVQEMQEECVRQTLWYDTTKVVVQ